MVLGVPIHKHYRVSKVRDGISFGIFFPQKIETCGSIRMSLEWGRCGLESGA